MASRAREGPFPLWSSFFLRRRVGSASLTTPTRPPSTLSPSPGPPTTITMAFRAASVLLALASSVTAFPTFASPWATGSSQNAPVYVNAVVESLAAPPRGWALDETRAVDKDAAQIKLRMHLVHQDMDKFYETALNIATPGHSMYGGHLSQKQIDGIIAPKDESAAVVMDWLETMGLRSYASLSKRGDSVIIEASVAQVERLLDAEYSAYCECLFHFSRVRARERERAAC